MESEILSSSIFTNAWAIISTLGFGRALSVSTVMSAFLGCSGSTLVMFLQLELQLMLLGIVPVQLLTGTRAKEGIGLLVQKKV